MFGRWNTTGGTQQDNNNGFTLDGEGEQEGLMDVALEIPIQQNTSDPWMSIDFQPCTLEIDTMDKGYNEDTSNRSPHGEGEETSRIR